MNSRPRLPIATNLVLFIALAALAVRLPAASPAPGADWAANWNKDNLNVVGAVPLPGEALQDSIVFFFDATLAGLQPREGATPAPFTIQPALGGQFQIGPNFVRFKIKTDSLANVISRAASQVFRVTLNSDLRASDGRPINPRQRQFNFAPFVFGPTKVWPLEETPERLTLALGFPLPVKLDELRTHLTVRQRNGQEAPFQVNQGTDEKTYRLAIEGKPAQPLRIAVSKGLADRAGDLLMVEDRELFYSKAPEISPLAVEGAEWGRFGQEVQTVLLRFSAPVDAEDLNGHLSINDVGQGATIPFTLETSGQAARHAVQIHLGNLANVRIAIHVSEGLPGAGQSALPSPWTTELTRKAEPLHVINSYIYPRGKAGLVLNLQLSRPASAQELQAHLQFNPPLPNLRVETESSAWFNISGDWNSRQSYQMKITPGLKDSEGQTHDEAVLHVVKTPEIPPFLQFSQPGQFYIPRRAASALALEARNAKKAAIRTYRMFPSNVAVALNDMDEGRGSFRFNESWAEETASTEIALTFQLDRLVPTPLDLQSLLPKDKKGVFCLDASLRDEEEGANDTKLVLMTDIGLLSHWQDKELVLFAHDLYSLAPLPAAKVSVYSSKNQLLGQGQTDAQGLLHLADFNPLLGRPAVAVVEHKDDYSFLELKPRDEDSRSIDSDMPPYDGKAYDAFLYADRELYRPGETAHLHWIVRQNYGQVVANVPLLLKVLKPNGRELVSRPTILSALGTGGMDIPTQRDHPTGRYRAQLLVPGAKTPIGEYPFFLEEFVPNRIKAHVAAGESPLIAGQPREIIVSAQHLFGAPAAERKCEVKVIPKRGNWATRKWKEFVFDNDSEFTPSPVSCGQSQTGAEGNASFQFTYRAPAEVTFPMEGLVRASVFELGGRAVVATTETLILPSNLCLGVAASPAPGGRGVEVFAAAIQPDESPASLDRVSVALERQTWNYYVRRYYDSNQANWSESFEPVETREVALQGGKGSTVFPLGGYGYYRLRVFSKQTPQYATVSFYSYGGKCEIVNAARPSLIKMTLDKESYEIGEEARARIESPFDGKGIVVLQGETIQQIVPVDIKDSVGVATFKIGPAQFPNVWVEATVIHALEQNRKQVYPFSSFAAVSLPVRDPQRRLDISFPSLPKETRPAGPFSLQIEARDAQGKPAQAELTLAAVDEGIHSMTGYQTPDPYGWLGRSRRPELQRAHYYDKIAYDFEKPTPGGDGEEGEMAKRIAPPDENWIRTVALWVQNLKTDKDGRTSATLEIPEFSGQLRLVALGCAEKSLGAHGENLFVRRPHMLRTSMPRFLLPGDAVQCRAVLFNQSGSPCKARLSWSVSGTLLPTAGSREFDLAPRGEASGAIDVAAGPSVGQGRIRWEAVFLDGAGRELERLAEDDPLPVRPPAAYETRPQLIVLKPGESRVLSNTMATSDTRAEMDLTVGANPLLRLRNALEFVARYPYGCVEQTTSQLMPLYLLRKNAEVVEGSLADNAPIDSAIRVGIERLLAMQTSSGGLSFWPGEPTPNPYGSIYALHFLTLVKTGREFDVPAPNFESLQDYVRQIALDWTDSSPSALYQRAYAVYALAIGGDLEAIQQIERFDNVTVPEAARFLLAAALAQSTRDSDRVKLYLSKAPSESYDAVEQGQTFNSEIRNQAVELLALLQIGGHEEEIAGRANRLIAFLEDRHHGSTQETAFVVTALGEYLSRLRPNIDQAAAAIVEPGGQKKEIRGRAVYRQSHAGKEGQFSVSNTGKADLYVNLVMRGVPQQAENTPASHGISVSRAILTSQGKSLASKDFRAFESYMVRLTIGCETNLENLIVSDLLPAGFEVENPRLDPSAAPGLSLPGAVVPSHLEIRDDRLVLAFNQLQKGTHTFYYVVRAVTPGLCQHPPVRAECMYDPSIFAQSAATRIEIRGGA